MSKIISDVVDVVVGATIGFLVGGPVGAIIGGAAGLGLGVLSTAKTTPTNTATADRLSTGGNVDPDCFRKIVFGRTPCGTDMRYWEVYGKTGYTQVFAAATHQINSFQEMYAEATLVTFDANTEAATSTPYKGYLTRRIDLNGNINANNYAPDKGAGSPRPSHSSDTSGNGLWNASSHFTGCAYFVLDWTYDQTALASGIPSKIIQVVEGALVYDPRKDSTVGGSGSMRATDQTTWAYSTLDSNNVPIGRNNALQMLWYELGWRNQGILVAGRGVSPNDFDWPAWIQAANDCELEQYYTDCCLSTGDSHQTNEQILAAPANGIVLDTGGLWSYHVATNNTANVAVYLNENDIVSAISFNPKATISSLNNQIGGSYIEPSTPSIYQSTPYTTISDATYISQDQNVKKRLNNDFQSAQSAALAQKAARVMLNRGRLTGQFQATFTLKALAATNWDCVRLTFSPLGFTNRLFRITSFAITPMGGIDLTLQDEDPSVYTGSTVSLPAAPSVGIAYDPRQKVPVTNSGNLGIAYIASGVIQGNNAVDSILIAWDVPPGNVLRTELQWKKHTDTVWTTESVTRDYNNYQIVPLLPNTQYDVQVRHVTISNVIGDWATATLSTNAVYKTDAGTVVYSDGTPVNTLKPAEAGANVTGTHISSGITGQTALTTQSSLAYGGNYLTGFGQLAPLSSVNFGSSNLLEASGGVPATLANFKTSQGVASAVILQGPFATYTTFTPTQIATPNNNIMPNGDCTRSTDSYAKLGTSLLYQAPSNGPNNAPYVFVYGNTIYINDIGAIQVGQPYSVQGMLFSAGLTSGQVRFYAQWLNAAKTTVISSFTILAIPYGQGWTYGQILNQIAPNNAAYLRIVLDTSDNNGSQQNAVFGSGGAAAWSQMKVELGATCSPMSNQGTTGALYSDGTSIAGLKPGEAGANVTENRTSASFKNQTQLSTQPSLSYGGSYLTGFGSSASQNSFALGSSYLTQSNGTLLSDGSVITSQGISSGYANQSPWGTYNTTSPGQLITVNTNLIPNSSFKFGFSEWYSVGSGFISGYRNADAPGFAGAQASGTNASQSGLITIAASGVYCLQAELANYGSNSDGTTNADVQFYDSTGTVINTSINTRIGIKNGNIYSGILISGSTSNYTSAYVSFTAPSNAASARVRIFTENQISGSNSYFRKLKLVFGATGPTPWSDDATTNARYSDDQSTINTYKPQEIGSNVTENRISTGYKNQTPWGTYGGSTNRLQYVDDTGRVTNGLNGLPTGVATGQAGVLNPVSLYSSGTATSITLVSGTYTYTGGSVSIPGGTISGLTAGTIYAIFYNYSANTFVCVNTGATPYYVAPSGYIPLGAYSTTSSSGTGGGSTGGGHGGSVP